MKNKSIFLNGKKIIEETSNIKLFLLEYETYSLIHLIKGQGNDFRKRIEFKKRNNDTKEISFSYLLPNWIAFSGELTIFNTNEITGNISFQFLKINDTKIIEGYYLNLNNGKCTITNIITKDIKNQQIEIKNIPQIYLNNIDIFLFNIILQINNNHSINNKRLITPISISKIIGEEQSILKEVQPLTSEYPELSSFITNYEKTYSRKRIR